MFLKLKKKYHILVKMCLDSTGKLGKKNQNPNIQKKKVRNSSVLSL